MTSGFHVMLQYDPCHMKCNMGLSSKFLFFHCHPMKNVEGSNKGGRKII